MLRASRLLILSLVTVLMAQASTAASFESLPATAGPETEFKQLLNSANYRQALLVWGTAHGRSTFGSSPSGVALYAYLLFQNGMPYTALQILTENTQPTQLRSDIQGAWKVELKNSALVQKSLIAMSGGWQVLVDNRMPQVRLNGPKDVAAAFAQAERIAKEQVNAKARIWWQIATRGAQLGDVNASLKALALLKGSAQTAIGMDLILSTEGRVRYQKGDFTGALAAFTQIPKSSSLWTEAVEERAWTYLRQDDFDKAYGEVATLLMPALSSLVGPETYFLSNLMALKVCDYTRLFKTSETFKKRQKNRLIEIQDLAMKGSNKNLSAALERFEKSGVSLESIGNLYESIPRSSLRDVQFVRAMESRHQLLAEASVALELKAQSSALGGEAQFERLATSARSHAEHFRPVAIQRMRTLAQRELAEYKMVLNKMHIIEAEVIERLHLDENLKGKRSQVGPVADKGDVMIFPQTSEEVWFDELDNFKARVKDCPTLKGASL
jgi:hypothetical protein